MPPSRVCRPPSNPRRHLGRLALAFLAVVALARPAYADERCAVDSCPGASEDAPLDDARIRLDNLVARLAPLATIDREAVGLELSAERLTVTGTTALIATDVTLTLASVRVTARQLERTADGQITATDLVILDADEVALGSADRLTRAPGGALRLERLTVHHDTAHLVVDRLERTAAGEVRATNLTIDVCGCPDDSGLLEPRVHVGQVTPTDDGLELRDLEVELAGLSWSLPTGPVHDDLRATGLMFPTLGYDAALGFFASLPVFVRLGRHVDLTPSVGWATEVGPTLGLRLRHHLDRFTRGEVALVGRYDLDGASVEGRVRGAATATWFQRLRLLTRLDLLAPAALHVERTGTLWDRARHASRSTLSFGWDGDQLALFATGDLLQSRPHVADVLDDAQRDDVFPDALPAVHRLPSVGLGLLTWPMAMTRFDLDARYTHTESLGGPGWLDVPGGDPALGVLAPVVEPRLGNARFAADEDLVDTVEHLDLRAGLEVPISLAGYGSLRPAIALSQRYDLADRIPGGTTAFARHTAFDAAVELSTPLVAAGDAWSHLLRPHLAWRARLFESASDTIGAPTVTGARTRLGAPHAFEAGLRAAWAGAEWQLDASLLGVAMLDIDADRPLGGASACPADLCALGLAELGLTLFEEDFLTLDMLIELPATHPDAPSAVGSLEVGPGWLRGRLSALHVEGALWSVGRPSLTQPAAAWHAPRRVTAPDEDDTREVNADTLAALLGESEEGRRVVDVTELGVASTFVGLTLSAATALVHRPDFGLEARGALGYTGDCNCWHVGVAVERHMTTPEWDVMATVQLLPGAAAASSTAFYAPRVQAGTPF